MLNCPCGTNKPYERCCRLYHEGQLPKTALQLMRSRYSAYALNLPKYIIATTHPDHPNYHSNHDLFAEEISAFSETTQFVGLEILGFEERGNMATVTFTAHLIQNGKKIELKEKSLFKKVKGAWLYLKSL